MYLAIDVGASKTLLALFDAKGKITKQTSFKTPADSKQAGSKITQAGKKLIGRRKLKSIGLGLPCSIDQSTKKVIGCGNLGWAGSDIANEQEAKFKSKVFAQNDAVLAGLAEARLGAAKGFHSVLYITISTGVGTGIIINGKIPAQLSASEGGMMVIANKDQSYRRLEDLVAGPEFKERFGKYGFDVIDPNIWDAFAKDLAAGIFNMITLIQPDVVVLGGGMSVHYAAFRKPLLKYLEQLNPGLYPTPPLKQAKHVETAVVYGAYLLAKQSTNSKKQ